MGSVRAAAALALPLLTGAAFLAILATFYYGGNRVPKAPPLPPLQVELHALVGVGTPTHVPRTALLLHLDLAGVPVLESYSVELDDVLGVKVLTDGVGAQQSFATVKVPKLPPGVYFVRVTAPSGALLREYGIRVK